MPLSCTLCESKCIVLPTRSIANQKTFELLLLDISTKQLNILSSNYTFCELFIDSNNKSISLTNYPYHGVRPLQCSDCDKHFSKTVMPTMVILLLLTSQMELLYNSSILIWENLLSWAKTYQCCDYYKVQIPYSQC